jgi:hypothetical protein
MIADLIEMLRFHCWWKHDYVRDWYYDCNMHMKTWGLTCRRCGHWK